MSKYREKYPWLRLMSLYSGKVIESDYDAVDDFPVGWFTAFGEMMLEELDKAIKSEPGLVDDFVVLQVKEKYGSLRFYVSHSTKRINRIIEKYEFISEYVCVNCGKPDVYMLDKISWISPYCEECFNKFYKTMSYDSCHSEQSCKIPNSYVVTRYSNGVQIEERHYIKKTVDKIRKNYEKRVKE